MQAAQLAGEIGRIPPCDGECHVSGRIVLMARSPPMWAVFLLVFHLVEPVPATTLEGGRDLHTLDVRGPCAWLFGNEAHGLPADVLAGADTTVAIPIYGHAESLNLAMAATLCLYASARHCDARLKG